MNIFEFAMQMEKDGEEYYHSMMKNCSNPRLHEILSMLAESEVKHYNVLKRMKDQVAPDWANT